MKTEDLLKILPEKARLTLEKGLRPKLNRFTSLPVALDILARKQITFLSPDTWEDRNDAYYLERYREKSHCQSVLALCFSTESETFHHWRIFSSGVAGVCLEFDKEALLAEFDEKPGFRHQKVSYHYILSLSKNKPNLERWPFLKRKLFEAESEYRIIYETKKDLMRTLSFAIPISTIQRITLSPWLPEAMVESITNIIRSIEGCRDMPINKSTLIDNAGWRKIID